MSNENKESEEAREKYMEFQLLQQQLEQMQKYNEELESKLAEFIKTKESLNELNGIHEAGEMFVPLAQGIFTKAKVHGMDELLVNVGADIAVTKSIPEVVDLIERQMKELAEIKEHLDENALKITERLNKLVEEIQIS